LIILQAVNKIPTLMKQLLSISFLKEYFHNITLDLCLFMQIVASINSR